MFNFWENVSRYPRFFISAMFGLTLILVSPIKSLFKTNQGRLFFLLGFIIILVIIGIILKNMLDL